TDGTTPTSASPVYTAPLTIASDTTVQFLEFYPATAVSAAGQSPVIAEPYVIDTVPPTVSSDPVPGFYHSVQSVSLMASEPATIYYTTDGTTPGTSSAVFGTAIRIATTTTLKFLAVDRAGNQSPVTTAVYNINVGLSGVGPLDPNDGLPTWYQDQTG